MTKEQFMEKVMEGLQKEFPPEDYHLQGNIFRKNNDTIRYGIMLKDRTKKVAPTIYLDNFYMDYQEKKITIGEIVETITKVYEGAGKHLASYQTLSMDFEECKSKIIYRLVSKDLNTQYLENIPHIPFLNMAITFHVVCKLSEEGIEALGVTNQLLERWQVSTKDLFLLAEENTPRMLPIRMDAMAAFILRYMGLEDSNFPMSPEMLIVSNQYQINGASVILYKDMLQTLAEKYEKNLYILPSSIHELIILPEFEGDMGLEEYSQMVKEINENHVSKEEVLANNAFLYDWKEKKFVF